MFGTIETVLRKCFESAGENVKKVLSVKKIESLKEGLWECLDWQNQKCAIMTIDSKNMNWLKITNTSMMLANLPDNIPVFLVRASAW